MITRSKTDGSVDALLTRRLRELPREVTPETDLWPAIERRIRRRKWQPLSYTTAAALLLISVVTISIVELRPQEEPLTTVAPDGESAEWAQQSAQLEQLRAGLQPTLTQRLAELDPETRGVVVENLAIIEQAQQTIEDALQMRPQSVVLNNRYRQLWLQEMAIYRRVSSQSYQM